MRLSVARRILSGELVPYRGSQTLALAPLGFNECVYLTLSRKDIEFMLRQLALKTEREKGK